MKNKIRRYVPSFVTGVDEEVFEFSDSADLKEVPFVKSVLDKGCNIYMDKEILMTEYTDGKKYPLGFIENYKEINI